MQSQPNDENKPPRSKPEPIGLRVKRVRLADGNAVLAYLPASESDRQRLKPANHKEDDLVFVQLKKPRNPGYHRMAHALGKLVTENIDDFHGMSAHEALKVLQLESGAACESLQVEMRSIWRDVVRWIGENMGESWVTVLTGALSAMGVKQRRVTIRVPLSLSYSSLDQMQFVEAIKQICAYLVKRYWPTMKQEELEQKLAELTDDLLRSDG